MLIPIVYSCGDRGKRDELRKEVSAKSDTIRMYQKRMDRLLKDNNDLKEDAGYWFSDREIESLKQKGLIDPLQDITEKLSDTPGLIPYPGVLGGTMRFGKISLIRDRWAIAEFDDGHILGTMILRYSVSKDTTLKWTVVDKDVE